MSMVCDVAERLENMGRVAGRAEGKIEGEAKLASLISKLLAAKRYDDIEKATVDEAARKRFYKEFGIAD